jgi:hypothetical protein
MKAPYIIDLALENLLKETGIKGKWKTTPVKELDGTLDLTIDKQTFHFNAEIKKELRNHQLTDIKKLAETHKPMIIVAERIFPALKEELRKSGIAYLETNGNIFMKLSTSFLWIDGLKPTPIEKEKGNRVFTKTGIKVVFNLLQHEEYLNLTYREIAQICGVSLGNINYVINGLIEMRYLISINKDSSKLINKKELLNKWINAYEEKLKPALEIGKFRFLKNEDFLDWQKLAIKSDKTYWGGEPGADVLTNHLHPAILTLYTEETRTELIKNYRLIPDVDGNVIVYQKFWKVDDVNYSTAPPLLIYADLLHSNENRCIETAAILYEKILRNQFEKV